MNIYRNFDANTICTEMIFTVALLFIHIRTKINISILIGYYKTWFYNMIKIVPFQLTPIIRHVNQGNY